MESSKSGGNESELTSFFLVEKDNCSSLTIDQIVSTKRGTAERKNLTDLDDLYSINVKQAVPQI
jgi:hypothetical protein